ncbi:hypothetical protein 2 [Hubei sobemo-like virus 33]|uniref:hypothetical protein 2 n=1 Tax=Hubei sobemo-like virus 33 TaxID=1923220 RepID=UPI00090CB18F|nr:hypothetical protein 2 [Hubei sobemo-like virus 33]APG75751.1 hypothetical protein 2 [Hubei sobemo-like virus 33]
MPGKMDLIHIEEILLNRWKAARWRIPDDFLERTHFERVVLEIDWTSSPGYPWLLQHTTNSAFFEVKDGKPSKAALDRVWTIVQQRLQSRECDPIRLFIKPEPHKQKKLDSKAYRLISSVSVIDQIIDALLFGEMNQRMIERYLDVPGKVGWSPYVGGWKIMPAYGNVSLDKSAWDWSVNAWIIQCILNMRMQLCDNVSESWIDLACWRYNALYNSPLFVTSGGLLLRQLQPGVVKSGCYNTIADNSIAQDLLHVRVCVELDIECGDLMSMGDDTTQRWFSEFPDYVERLSQYCHVKGSVNGTEFAGHRFTSCSVEPLYKGKHAYNIMNMNPKYGEETAASYALLYHRSVHSNYIRALLERMGYTLPSRQTLDVIYDGEV